METELNCLLVYSDFPVHFSSNTLSEFCKSRTQFLTYKGPGYFVLRQILYKLCTFMVWKLAGCQLAASTEPWQDFKGGKGWWCPSLYSQTVVQEVSASVKTLLICSLRVRAEKVLQEFSVYNLNLTLGFFKLSYEEDNYSIISTNLQQSCRFVFLHIHLARQVVVMYFGVLHLW